MVKLIYTPPHARRKRERPISFDIHEEIAVLSEHESDSDRFFKGISRYSPLLLRSKQRHLEMSLGEKRILYVSEDHISSKTGRRFIAPNSALSKISDTADFVEKLLKARYWEQAEVAEVEAPQFFSDPEVELVIKERCPYLYDMATGEELDQHFYDRKLRFYRPRLGEKYPAIFSLIFRAAAFSWITSGKYGTIIVFAPSRELSISSHSAPHGVLHFAYVPEVSEHWGTIHPSENGSALGGLANELGVSVESLRSALPRLLRIRNPTTTIDSDRWPAMQALSALNAVTKAAVEELAGEEGNPDESPAEEFKQLVTGALVASEQDEIYEIAQRPTANTSDELMRAKYRSAVMAWRTVSEVLPGLENTYYKALSPVTRDIGEALADDFNACDVLLTVTLQPYYERMLAAAMADERDAKGRFPDLEMIDQTRLEMLRRLVQSLTEFVRETSQRDAIEKARDELRLEANSASPLGEFWTAVSSSEFGQLIDGELRAKMESALRQKAPETTAYVASTVYNIGHQTILAASESVAQPAERREFVESFKKESGKQAAQVVGGVAKVFAGTLAGLALVFMNNWAKLSEKVSPVFERLRALWDFLF